MASPRWPSKSSHIMIMIKLVIIVWENGAWIGSEEGKHPEGKVDDWKSGGDPRPEGTTRENEHLSFCSLRMISIK